MIKWYFVVLVPLLVAGCAGQGLPGTNEPSPPAVGLPTPAPQPTVNLSGYPPEFRQGYADGCASVNAARKRDEARFKSAANYAQGWRDGYDICQRQK